MQTRAHIPGEFLGETSSQLPSLTLQNGDKSQSQASTVEKLRSWHESNEGRKFTVEKIFQFLQSMPCSLNRRKIAYDLEKHIYQNSASEDEYQRRLGMLEAKCIQTYTPHPAVSTGIVGRTIPTPNNVNTANGNSIMAISACSVSATSVPTSNTMVSNSVGMGSIWPAGNRTDQIHANLFSTDDNSNGSIFASVRNKNIFSNSGDNLSSMSRSLNNIPQSQQGAGCMSTGTSNQILPAIGVQNVPSCTFLAPGSGTTHVVLMSTASYSEAGFPNVDCMGTGPSQLFTGVQNDHIYCNSGRQTGGTMGGIKTHQKDSSYDVINGSMNCAMQLTTNNQILVNETTAASNIGYVDSSHYSDLQAYTQQNVAQQHPPRLKQYAMPNRMGPLSCDAYARNSADLTGSGNLYDPTSLRGYADSTSFNGNPLGLHFSKMIPVPGLPSPKEKSPGQGEQNQSQLSSVSHGFLVSPKCQTHQLRQEHPQEFQQHQHQQQHQMHPHRQQHQCQIRPHREVQHNQQQQLSAQQHQYQMHPHQQILQNQQQRLSAEREVVPQNQPDLVIGHNQGGIALNSCGIEIYRTGASQQDFPKQNKILPLASEQKQLPGSDPFIQEYEVLSNHSSTSQEKSPEQCHDEHSARVEPEDNLNGEQELHYQQVHQLPRQYEEELQQEPPQVLDENIAQNHESCQQILGNGIVLTATSRMRSSNHVDTVGHVQPNNSSERLEKQYWKPQVWLLFFRHASKCSAPAGQCKNLFCSVVRDLWLHICHCFDKQCSYQRCQAARTLLTHNRKCRSKDCPVCDPVRQLLRRQRANLHAQSSTPGETTLGNARQKVSNGLNAVQINTKIPASSGSYTHDTPQHQEPPLKRSKIETMFSGCAQQEVERTMLPARNPSEMQCLNQIHTEGFQSSCHDSVAMKSEALQSFKMDAASLNMDQAMSSQKGLCQTSGQLNKDACQNPCPEHGQTKAQLIVPSDEIHMQVKGDHMQVEHKSIKDVSHPDNSASGEIQKSRNRRQGVSMIEFFTPEMVREHVTVLRQCVNQTKANTEQNEALEHHMNDNACQMCGIVYLKFDPLPVYCSARCGHRIKRNARYYVGGLGDTKHVFCTHCYSDSRGNAAVTVDGAKFNKSELEMCTNDTDTGEAWVQCDKCNAWQHQICALYNARRDDGGQAEYTCPKCYISELETGVRKPLPDSDVLGAKDLPRTFLSDHIEQRLFRQLKEERQERANSLGKSFEEVPGAEALSVRVVSSVDKKLNVKQRLLEIFQHENYPTEFLYRSKVLLLFQKIDGVEVCLFAMYVQEYGAECPHPNQRRIYLAYLDSVKYFRPDVKTVKGEALRTFVYHEIIIGYLEYCKGLGFTSCYIWACPPAKGEDYILYCHPQIQKTPRAEKLRDWYFSMLKKARKDDIVVDMTNLYDYFFVSTRERKAKVTPTRLPYFEGDYWPGAAEEWLILRQKEEEEGQKHAKTGKYGTKRSTKTAAQAEVSSNPSIEQLLMKKVGDNIHQMKEDFIMVHLQHACTHCCLFIMSGTRWVCKKCKNFQLCDKCHEAEQKLDERERHPFSSREKHALLPIDVIDVPVETQDKDDIMESDIFDTRQGFLSLCQGNHYQYDTLRRAKHSSMMVLYHLHNPDAPAYVPLCNTCYHVIETGQGWRCETCPDFDICKNCYKNDTFVHPHGLIPHPSQDDQDPQNQAARQKRVHQQRMMMDLLKHACQCPSPGCGKPDCSRIKTLFRHAMQCRSGQTHCNRCKNMWCLLMMHARTCKESCCNVHRCKDLRQKMRRQKQQKMKRQQQQSESRRRSAFVERIREQRKAGNS